MGILGSFLFFFFFLLGFKVWLKKYLILSSKNNLFILFCFYQIIQIFISLAFFLKLCAYFLVCNVQCFVFLFDYYCQIIIHSLFIMNLNIYMCMCVYVCACIHIYIYIYIYFCVCVCVCVCECVPMCKHMCMCISMYAYVYVYM